MFGTPFELFGSVHLITIVVIIAVTVLLPKFYKNKSEDQKSVMSKIIATCNRPTCNYFTIQRSIYSCKSL
jgi:hypothetical protein